MATNGNPIGAAGSDDTAGHDAERGNVFRQAKTLACAAADDMIDAGEEIVTSPVSKKIAAGAAVGALVAAPLPIIGWAAGATIGAGLVAFKHLRKRG